MSDIWHSQVTQLFDVDIYLSKAGQGPSDEVIGEMIDSPESTDFVENVCDQSNW